MRAIVGAGIAVALMAACSSSESSLDDDGSSSGTSTTKSCLDENRQPTADCPIVPSEEVCDRAPNPDCAVLLVEEVSVSTTEGACLRLMMRNDCSQTLYSRTCIEHNDDDGDPTWQCWWSTTLPGFDIDLGQCEATGAYKHWWGLSSGELDVVDGDCDPS